MNETIHVIDTEVIALLATRLRDIAGVLEDLCGDRAAAGERFRPWFPSDQTADAYGHVQLDWDRHRRRMQDRMTETADLLDRAGTAYVRAETSAARSLGGRS